MIGEEHYDRHRYARGYILSSAPPKCPSHWPVRGFSGMHLAHAPELEVRQAGRGDAALVALGIIFDTRFPDKNSDNVLASMAAALALSEGAFFELLSHAGGRFVLLCSREGHTFVVTDAAGLRCALYSRQAGVVGSHLRLIADNMSTVVRRPRITFLFGYPGADTPIEDVSFLPPNCRLDLADMSLSRYWPKRSIDPMGRDEALQVFIERLKNSFDWISRNYDPFISLTGGMDSRVALAMAGTKGRYFTYMRTYEQFPQNAEVDRLDREFVEAATKRFGLDHTLFYLKDCEEMPEQMMKVIQQNTFYRSMPQIAYQVGQRFVRSTRSVHIRSNVSEIGRMFYTKRNVTDVRSGEDAVALWSEKESLHTPENIEAFQRFIESTRFIDAPVEKTSLFYWEHRMGAWLSQVLTEADFASDTLSLYNCRHLLTVMLSVSESDQKRSWLLRAAINELWPELTEYPVNGKRFAVPA